MKVLIVIGCGAHARRTMSAWARAWAALGDDVTVVAADTGTPVDAGPARLVLVNRTPESDPEEARGFAEGPAPELAWGCVLGRAALEEHARAGFDWIEAPADGGTAYFLQMRLLLSEGAGARRPPVFVHVVEPEVLVAEGNGTRVAPPYRHVGRRHELASLRMAERVVCESQALGQWVVRRVGISAAQVACADVPHGEVPILASWPHGTSDPMRLLLCGGCEPRHGVLELLQALRALERRGIRPSVTLVGPDLERHAYGDGPFLDYALSTMPAALRERVQRVDRPADADGWAALWAQHDIALALGRVHDSSGDVARALAAGRPVVALESSGWSDWVMDGRTGWMVQGGDAKALADTLATACSTTRDVVQSMGAAAAKWSQELEANASVGLNAERRLREECVRAGAARRLWQMPAGMAASVRRTDPQDVTIGIVVTCYNLGRYLDESLGSIRMQADTPTAWLVVDDGSTDSETAEHLARWEQQGAWVVRQSNAGVCAARMNGFAALLERHPALDAVVFLDADDRLRPAFVARAREALRALPEVGLVSCLQSKFGDEDGVWAEPCPEFPFQWLMNGGVTFSAYRVAAFRAVGGYRQVRDGCYSDWDLNNSILAAGWLGITVPEVLGDYRIRADSMLRGASGVHHNNDLRELFERHAALLGRDAVELVLLAEAENHELRLRLTRIRTLARHPARAIRFVWEKVLKRLLG